MPLKSLIEVLLCVAILAGCTSEIDGIYSRGIDAYSDKRYAEAAPLIKRAAEADHRDGMAVLGAMYLFGRGVGNDAQKATQWLELAANGGQVDAQSILGIMYATGQGVARNIPEATKWLTIASEAGDKHAIRMLQMIEGPK